MRLSHRRLLQVAEKRLCCSQIGSTKTLCEPIIDRGEKLSRLLGAPLGLPQSGETAGRAA